MSNTKSKSPMVYDVRVLQRNVGDGTLTNDDVANHLATLPDVAAKGTSFETSLRGGFEREEEEEAGEEQE